MPGRQPIDPVRWTAPPFTNRLRNQPTREIPTGPANGLLIRRVQGSSPWRPTPAFDPPRLVFRLTLDNPWSPDL